MKICLKINIFVVGTIHAKSARDVLDAPLHGCVYRSKLFLHFFVKLTTELQF